MARVDGTVIRLINRIGWPLNRPLIWLYERNVRCVGCKRRGCGMSRPDCGVW